MAAAAAPVRFIRGWTRTRRSAPPLPACLQYQTALILTLPETHPLRQKIDVLRKAYDRNYMRWPMPHIKLFVHPSSSNTPITPKPDPSKRTSIVNFN